MAALGARNSANNLNSRRLYKDVVDQIGIRIACGDYAAGDVLPGEEELAAEFGVSRTVIREAVKVLTEKGLVQPRPKIGTLVHPRTNWNWLDSEVLNWEITAGQVDTLLHRVTEARRVIEPEVAALAAERVTDEEIEQMIDAYRRMEQHTEDLAEYIAADMAFHNLIMQACRNQMLAQMANTMWRALVVSREITLKLPGSSVDALPLHRAVLDAIRNRDPQAAYTAMRNLIERARADIDRSLGQFDGKQGVE